jgi:hypothetical protein
VLRRWVVPRLLLPTDRLYVCTSFTSQIEVHPTMFSLVVGWLRPPFGMQRIAVTASRHDRAKQDLSIRGLRYSSLSNL